MNFSHLLVASVLFTGSAYVVAQPPADPVTPASIVTEQVTPEEQAALDALQAALAAATTDDQKSQIIADAISATPTLASNPALSSSLQSMAIRSGLSIAQVDTAVLAGLADAPAPAAGPAQNEQDIATATIVDTSSNSTGGGNDSASGG